MFDSLFFCIFVLQIIKNMKNLLVLLFLLPTACFSQYTKEVKTFPVVEKAVFESINKYREERDSYSSGKKKTSIKLNINDEYPENSPCLDICDIGLYDARALAEEIKRSR